MSSVVIAGNTSGSVTLDAPAVAGTTVLTLPATSGTVLAPSGGTLGATQGGTGLTSAGSNGNVLTSNGTTWTSAALPAGGVTSLNGQTGAITNTDYGAIGSYVIAGQDDFTASQERLPDVTVAGSTLIRSNQTTGTIAFGINSTNGTNISSANYVSLSLSGTWRRLTRGMNANSGSGTSINLYVRIS